MHSWNYIIWRNKQVHPYDDDHTKHYYWTKYTVLFQDIFWTKLRNVKTPVFNYTHLRKFIWSNATCNVLISRGFRMNWSFLFEPLHSNEWKYGQKMHKYSKNYTFQTFFFNFYFKIIFIKFIPSNNIPTNVTFLFQNNKVMKRVPRDFTHLSQRVIFFDFILFLFVLLII